MLAASLHKLHAFLQESPFSEQARIRILARKLYPNIVTLLEVRRLAMFPKAYELPLNDEELALLVDDVPTHTPAGIPLVKSIKRLRYMTYEQYHEYVAGSVECVRAFLLCFPNDIKRERIDTAKFLFPSVESMGTQVVQQVSLLVSQFDDFPWWNSTCVWVSVPDHNLDYS